METDSNYHEEEEESNIGFWIQNSNQPLTYTVESIPNHGTPEPETISEG